MKTFISLLGCLGGVLLLLGVVHAVDTENEDERINEVIEHLHQERLHLRRVLHNLRNKLDKSLIEFFPEMEEQIGKIRANIDVCYSQTIGKTERVNIFEAKIHDIVRKFFKSHGHLLKGKSQKEIHQRVRIFIGNLRRLVTLMVDCVRRKEQGLETSKFGLTPLAAFSREEIQNKILNKNIEKTRKQPKLGGGSDFQEEGQDNQAQELEQLCSEEPHPKDSGEIPAKFDWREKKAVSPVYQQFSCGSCYVFATTSALESQYLLKNKEYRQFSVQSTLSCMEGGCTGGGLTEPMEFMVKHGVTLEAFNPYQNQMTPCKRNFTSLLKADKSCYHSNLNETIIQRLILRNGPASVALAAGSDSFHFLKDSPYNSNECDGKPLDHATLMVGWTEKHWIIKNSWSDTWGIDGYLYLPRGVNKCGVNSMFGVPIVNHQPALIPPPPPPPTPTPEPDEPTEDPENAQIE